jgi:hypothetical protein
MKRFVWHTFWALQALGLACLVGGVFLAIPRISLASRIIAVIVLEPGYIVMQAVIDRAFFNTTTVSASQQFWIASVSAVGINALFLLFIFLFLRNLRPPQKN